MDGQAKLAFFNQPTGLAVNAAGDVFVADAGNSAIRKIDTAGNVTTIAGSGVQGFKDGTGEAASFNHPQDVATAADGTLYVADTLNHVIRRITPQGQVTTIGTVSTRTVELRSGVAAFAGSYKNGSLADAQFNEPAGLALDSKGNLYVSDSGNQVIRYINFAKGTVTTAAGAEPSVSAYQAGALYADYGFADGDAAEARFHSPRGLSWSEETGLVIADSLNHVVRKLKDGQVTTITGSLNGEGSFTDGIESESRYNTPTDVTLVQDGKLLIADTNNSAIREWTSYTPPVEWKKGSIAVVYGDQLLTTDVAPQVKQGRVMLPIRAMGKLIGFTLAPSDNGRIQLKKGNQTIWLTPGKRNVIIETAGSPTLTLTTDVAPYVLKGRVIASLRLLAEIMNKDVQWISSDKLVIIRDLKHPSSPSSAAVIGPTARFMEITALRGESKVSFGGTLSVDAYIGMKLGEGAVLSTGANATAQLRTLDKGDELTVGSNTILAATELRGIGEGILTTRLALVAGHVYSHVADLTHSEDRFEIQTGQMTNTVRGTQFITSYVPSTGQMKLVLASGKVDVSTTMTKEPSTNGSSSGGQTTIYPSQQITLGENSEAPLNETVDYIDLDDLIQSASPDVISEIIKNKADIDKENNEFLEKAKKNLSSGGTTPADPNLPNLKTQDDLDKVQKNLDQLIGNIAKEALDNKKLEQEVLDKIIEELNKKLEDQNKKLDLDNVKPLDKTAGGLFTASQEQKQQELKRLEDERKAMQEQQQKLLEQLQAQLGSKLNSFEEKRKELEAASKKAMEDAQKQAEEALLKMLSEMQQSAFLIAQQQAALEKSLQKDGKLVTSESPPVPTPPSPSKPVVKPDPPVKTPKAEIVYSEDASTEIRAGSYNYFQSLYFETENIDLDTEVQVKVTIEKDGQPVTGIPVKFNESMVESNFAGIFILRKSSDENYTLAELQDQDNSVISYSAKLMDPGQYTEKTELLKVTEQDPVVLGSFTRTLTVTPDAVFDYDYENVNFDQNVEGLWKFQSHVYGLADDTEVGYRITFTGPDNQPVAGQVLRIIASPHGSEEEPQEGDIVIIETNSDGSTLLRLSQTGAGTVVERDLAGEGIDLSLNSTFAAEGSYLMTVQLVHLDGEANTDIGEPMQWNFNVNPTL
nr:stalk domain-containing protein [Paenibacillus lupini]